MAPPVRLDGAHRAFPDQVVAGASADQGAAHSSVNQALCLAQVRGCQLEAGRDCLPAVAWPVQQQGALPDVPERRQVKQPQGAQALDAQPPVRQAAQRRVPQAVQRVQTDE